MLKTISKFVLVAAVAAFAMSFSTPTYAAKKKAAAPATCVAWQYKTAQCNNLGWCSMQRCGLDGKWYPSLMACWQPACPK
jgi:hypothetical protein